jgi:hypothetical protein
VITKDDLGTDRPGEICQIRGEVYQKVVNGNHPCELSVLHYRQTSHSVRPKQCKRVPQLCVERNRDHRRRHHRVNSAVRRYSNGEGSSDEIAVGHNPEKSRAVYNGQGADAATLHDHSGIVDCSLGPDPDSGSAYGINCAHGSSFTWTRRPQLRRRIPPFDP